MLKLSVRIEAPSAVGPSTPAGVPEVNIWRDNGGRVSAFLSRSSRGLGICFPKFASYIFPEAEASQECIQIVVKPAAVATRDQIVDQLMRNVVPLLLQARGIQVLHASAIRIGNGVLGLCGTSYSGKSTLAYALCKRGYEAWADDSLLISVTPQDVRTVKASPVKWRLRLESKKYFGDIDGPSLCTKCDDTELELYLSTTHEAPLEALCLIRRVPETKQNIVWKCNKIYGHRAFTRILRLANYYNLAETAEHRRISENCLNIASKVPIYNCRYRDGFDLLEIVVDEIENSLLRLQ